jgi:23S rRNA pseudouridine1911/1915/1917 synthase
LIGDPSYGRAHQAPRPKTAEEAAAYAAAADFPRQALHAYVLGFQHPSTHEVMRFESKWPEDFAALVEALRGLKIVGP